jgi:hypothetical protein
MILQYDRIPITAEKPPDFADLSELIEVVMRTSRNAPIVVNCQLGGGRSTLASILLVLIRQWFEAQQAVSSPVVHAMKKRTLSSSFYDAGSGHAVGAKQKPRKSYQVINSESFFFLLSRLDATELLTVLLTRSFACNKKGACCQEYGG